MGYVVRMPQLGAPGGESEVLEWTVDEGTSVAVGDVLCVVESGGATADVEARETGVLRRIVAPEGSAVEPGTSIGVLAGAAEDLGPYVARADDIALETTAERDEKEEVRSVRVVTDSRYAGRYHTFGTVVPFDEPKSMGGGGTAPGPVEHLLGALESCLSLSVRTMAERDDVEVGVIETTVEGSPERGPLESISVELGLPTDAEEAAVERTVLKAERACYVARSLSSDLDVSLSWVRL
jgi:pyruvate/2-oxoglutarate dehydrogenase complex dihydrolipoamide acyltransferase (E2) component